MYAILLRRVAAAPSLLVLSGLITAIPATAWAQSPEPAVDSVQGVSVTARKEEAPTEGRASYRAGRSRTATGLALTPRETPQAISTITRSQLDDFGLGTVNDALAFAPGVTVERVETDRTYYSARGFDIDNFQLDGIGLPFTNGAQWGEVDTLVYDRIDVLRGANGLLTGTGLPSATINFVRKKPTSAFQASGGLTLGSWNKVRLEGDVSGALNADGSVRGRLVGAAQDSDSYLDRHGKRLYTLYGAVDIDLSRHTTLSLGWLERESRARSPFWGALPMNYTNGAQTDYDVSTNTAADWTWWNNKERRLTAELSHDFGQGWQLRTGLTHRSNKSDSELLYVFGTPVQGSAAGLYGYPSAFRGDYMQDLLHLQASGPFSLAGRQHEAAVGANWAKEDATEQSGYASYAGSRFTDLGAMLDNWDGRFAKPAMDASFAGSSFDLERRGVYGVARFSLSDAVKLITGAQLLHIRSSGLSYGVPHVYDATRLTPYLGAVWTLTPALAAYASHAQIYKPQTEVSADGKPLAPVRGSNAEVGLKADLLDRKLSLQAAVFRTRQDGLAGDATWVEGRNVYSATDARSQGIELEATGRVAEGVELSASLTHTDIEDADGQDTRTFLPRDTARVSVRYAATDRLSTTAAVRWQSAIHRDIGGVRATQDSHALLDVGASYQIDKHWKVSAQIRNLTDQKYINSLYWDQAFYGAPRHGQVSVNWTY